MSGESASVRTSAGALSRSGISESFFPGEHERVERVLADLEPRWGSRSSAPCISWAEWWDEDGREWYEWLVPRLAREVELLPCFVCTPPSYGEVAHTAAPPREPSVFADFLNVVLDRVGRHFEWVELWNEPNNPVEWNLVLDPGWKKFATTVGLAARVARHCGKRTVLGGMSPIDPNWLWGMFDHDVMDAIDAVGIHGFPGTYEAQWEGWGEEVARVRRVLDEHGSAARMWITAAGFSTVHTTHSGSSARSPTSWTRRSSVRTGTRCATLRRTGRRRPGFTSTSATTTAACRRQTADRSCCSGSGASTGSAGCARRPRGRRSI